MKRTSPYRLMWMLSSVGVLLVGITVWVFVGRVTATGDPGGKVMEQLTPTVSALPGYGTAALPWVSQMPGTLGVPYAIKDEPVQESCDGIAGTQGWSQVVVQAGFRWSKGLTGLVYFMNPRLTELGWSADAPQIVSNPPSQSWTKTLANGSKASLQVEQEGGISSPVWQLDAIAKPVGRQASVC